MILGYPAAVIPAGEHPVNAKCRRRIYPPFSACKTTPAVRKILPIFPTAFTGCNTLHFALQSRVPDVPSGLPYGRSYALLILRSTLRIKEWQHDGDGSCEGVFQKHRHHRHDRHAGDKGDSCGSRQGVSQNCCHRRHRCHPKGSLPAEERKMMNYALCNPAFPETQSGRRCGLRTPQRA